MAPVLIAVRQSRKGWSVSTILLIRPWSCVHFAGMPTSNDERLPPDVADKREMNDASSLGDSKASIF